jgi:DNA-binding NarL/FixJ family response regulator
MQISGRQAPQDRRYSVDDMTMFRRPTVFLSGDRARFCDAIAGELRNDFDVVGSANDAAMTVASVSRLRPDAVLIDVGIPLLTGIDVAEQIRESVPSATVVFVAIPSENVTATPVLRVGTLGLLIRASTISAVADAIWTLLGEGGVSSPLAAHLTTREKEVVQLLAAGKLMKQVADQLNVSTRTVAFHKYGVMRKLGLRSSADLVRMAVAQGLVA